MPVARCNRRGFSAEKRVSYRPPEKAHTKGWCFIGIKRPETTILADNFVKKAPNPSGFGAFLPCSVLKLMLSECNAVLVKMFFVLEKLKNADILTYVRIFFVHYKRKTASQNRILPMKRHPREAFCRFNQRILKSRSLSSRSQDSIR